MMTAEPQQGNLTEEKSKNWLGPKNCNSNFIDEKILKILQATYPNGPTTIQEALLSKFCSNSSGSYVICSKTGTGKTLSFGIPVLNRALISTRNEPLSKRDKIDHEIDENLTENINIEQEFDLNEMINDCWTDETYIPVTCLILAPSRELCHQIKKHLNPIAEKIGLNIMSLTGGSSHLKQKKTIEKNPDIVIGTPGRVFDYAQLDPRFSNSLKNLKILALDEADKLFDESSFNEVKSLLNIMKHRTLNAEKLQIFVISATLFATDGTTNSHVKKYLKKITNKLGLTHKFHVINQIDNAALPKSLEEFQICCLDDNKDLYLLYLLKKYFDDIERLIIFTNSKERLKKLNSKLKLFGYDSSHLSSGLNQHQRNENLDLFRKGKCKILLTTDLASRGFDIHDINLVIHYDVPNSQEQYIHRCGRTARNGKSGKSFLLLGAEEFLNFKKIAKKIGSNSKNMTVTYKHIKEFKEKSAIVNSIVSAKRAKLKIEEEMQGVKLLNDSKERKKCLNNLKNVDSQIELLEKRLVS